MRRRTIGLAIAAGALLLATSLPSQGAVLVRATAQRTFQPKTVEVAKGTRVNWRSVSGTHTVTAYKGDWSKDTTISSGEQTGFRFRKNGTFRYRCRFHSSLVAGTCSGMCGRVKVS
jgi:plastocyanin